MSKSLTKQWREGKLPVGSYYINLVGAIERVDFFEGLVWERTKDFGIEEVIAPVPSYKEYNQFADLSKKVERLEKQLEIAKKALDYYKKDVCGEPYVSRLATNTLKEMESVSVNEND